ncbi:hypothetical protein RB614_37785 [Phytohabitans sp. ZYX-F-186]|uniref:Uncharacterized protein n=1 Tax=Phytohabitans maris TaxID=3071409 RepID=A0ABU0ZT94_9ACTN|nr:hypothetical protein [Phytohabitans sp. ZYX-F-186]MDQ7910261.1 hypothetical protein [Phytohabitans sp. ZYX-F-186]
MAKAMACVVNGQALVYDTDDIECLSVSGRVLDVSPDGATTFRYEMTGFDLKIRFKDGAPAPTWVKEASNG